MDMAGVLECLNLNTFSLNPSLFFYILFFVELRFNIGKTSIYRWLNRESLEPKKVTTHLRKIDKVVLRKDVEENPDITLKARADKFNVAPSSICSALKKMNITRKKKNFGTRRETDKKG